MAHQDSDLKLQLQELQQQQQQKLLERRRKKEQANSSAKGKKSEGGDGPSGKFGVQDDLDLKLADPAEKGFGYVSEELVDHLNDQIRQIKDENGRLYKLLNEKDFEIRQLKKKSEDNKATAIDGHVTNETAATKIIELSKKVRELTAEKEREKTKVKQFQKKCHDLQIQLHSAPPPSEQSSMMGSMVSLRSAVDQKEESDGAELKAVQDRLKQSESRLTDFRNQCQQLRQELKVAHKVLTQEIGDSVNIQSLLNETSNWRGRAQQIIGLQQKVDELKVQLETIHGGNVVDGGEKVSTARKRKEERYREELRKMERERKEAQENATSKLKTLEEEHENLKTKLDAAKQRNKVLSNEIKGQKAQVQTLLKKSRNDDEFIEALMKQQGQLKGLLEQHSQQQAVQQMQQQQQLHQMSVKSQQDNNIVEQLKAIAAQKESQVKMLEMELQHLRMVASQNHATTVAMTTHPVTPQQPLVTATVDSRPPTSSEVELLTNRTFELPHSSLASARTVSRNSSRQSTIVGVQPSGQAPTTDTHVLQLEQLCQEQEMLRRAVEVERDKMTELVQVLQTRLSEETQRLAETQSELQGQKRLAVELEKRLGRQSLDTQRKDTAKGMRHSVKDGGEEESDEEGNVEKNELVTRLEIQKDENHSLKAALQRTLKAKTEDLKVYSNTLDETKKVFLEALRQMKEQAAGS